MIFFLSFVGIDYLNYLSCLLFVYKICCRPLEDQILDQKVICLTYDLFTTVNSDDVDFKAVISQLNSIIL